MYMVTTRLERIPWYAMYIAPQALGVAGAADEAAAETAEKLPKVVACKAL